MLKIIKCGIVKVIKMEKREENKVEDLRNIEHIEKEFRKTKYGKFMMVATIIFCVLTVIGLGIAVFEAIVNFRNLDMNIYQPIIDYCSWIYIRFHY